MQKIVVIGLVIIIMFFPRMTFSYSPEISGRLEAGDRLDTEYVETGQEVYADYYDYVRFWLRYRQQLAPGEYYYIRGPVF